MVASFVLKAMTEGLNVFTGVCVAASAWFLSTAQLWVSMETGQLIRAGLCLSKSVTGSCWVHDSVHAHPGLWGELGDHAYTHRTQNY